MQFPLHIRPFPRWEWPKWEFEIRAAERLKLAWRTISDRVDPDWVFGSVAWSILVYVIVHSATM